MFSIVLAVIFGLMVIAGIGRLSEKLDEVIEMLGKIQDDLQSS